MSLVKETITELAQVGVRPDLVGEGSAEFGSDLAMPCFSLAKEYKKSPQEIAAEIAGQIEHKNIARAEAVAGYLNLWLSDDALVRLAAEATEIEKSLAGQTVLCEFFDTNPLKIVHAGHLYTGITGTAIANLYQIAGANVVRLNYGGDVGLHVAQSLWAILQELGGEDFEKLLQLPHAKDQAWLSQKYTAGNRAYSEDEQAKQEIIDINKQVYAIHATNDHQSELAKIYWQCRAWSYESQARFFAKIGPEFDRIIPESENTQLGIGTVRQHMADGVYEESEGAIIFRGEKFGLHTRVFINSEGLPTYEAKDVGLMLRKWQDYHYDLSVVITDKAQGEYFKVMKKSVEQFAPEAAERTTHLTHGQLKLAGGIKMSSRRGNFLTADDVFDQAKAAAEASAGGDASESVYVSAIKYAFLRPTIGQDVIYDPSESVATHGNSGPYLQYAHARACSILRKSAVQLTDVRELDGQERILVQVIGRYPEVVGEAVGELAPNKICNYLYELTQAFNRFYEQCRIVSDVREAERLAILEWYKKVLAHGLGLLGIEAPERM